MRALFRRIARLATIVALAGASLVAPAFAQAPPATAAAASAPGSADDTDVDERNDSPRASLRAYFQAARSARWDEAARYLALTSALEPRGAELASRLKGVIDAHAWLDLETVSPESQGRRDDGLAADLEEVYHFELAGRVERLRMTRARDGSGAFWRFSPSTVSRIDTWYSQVPDRQLRDGLIGLGLGGLLLPGPLELLWWQWLVVPVLLGVSIVVGLAGARLTHWLLARLAARTPSSWDDDLLGALRGPLMLVWSLNLFWLGTTWLVLTDPARVALRSAATAGMVIAVFWALWSATRVASDRLAGRTWALESASARTLISVGGNLARGGLLVMATLAVLSALGYPVGSLLAGLGIGGLAIAFGAQKVVENLFGSVSLAIDQPFRVGDAVRIDNVVGTVENIGMRSTRVRTADRSVVSFPNGALAAQRLESLTARDRMLFATTLGLEYGATQAQIERVLADAERVLRDHPQVWPDTILVCLQGFGASSLDIEITAWFHAEDTQAFQRCRQDVLLGLLRVVEQAGVGLAFPTQTIHVVSPDR